ncbi:MAG: hypothetical protein ACREDM_05325 [Methylocella sp.]
MGNRVSLICAGAQGLDAKNDPLGAIAAMVPWERLGRWAKARPCRELAEAHAPQRGARRLLSSSKG